MAKRKPDYVLTDDFVGSAPTGIHRDGPRGVAGFLLRVGQRERSFAIRLERRGEKAVNKYLGVWPAISADVARADAMEKRKRFDAGLPVDDVAPKDGHTIASAWADFKSAPRKGSGYDKKPLTIAGHRNAFKIIDVKIRGTDPEVDPGVTPVRGIPLRELSQKPDIMRAEAARITQERGPSSNAGMTRFVKALYTHARTYLDETLPIDQPGRKAIIRKVPANRPVLMLDEMRDWNVVRRAIENPVRREYHLFALLSGLRRGDLETMRWENVKWRDGKAVIPAPKGGVERGGFDLILTWPMIATLIRVKRAVVGSRYAGSPWVFPGDSDAGHMTQGTDDPLKTNHAARRGYASAAEACRIPRPLIDQFLDHRPRDVTGVSYVRHADDMLAAAQRQISRRIVKALGGTAALRVPRER